MVTNETKIILALLIAAIMMAAILFSFVLFLCRYHYTYRAMSRQKLSAEMQACEQERKRIAADLHDDIGPLLALAKLQAECVVKDASNNRGLLKEVIQHIDCSLHAIRSLHQNLSPPLLQHRSLEEALRLLVKKVAAAGVMQVSFICKPLPCIPDTMATSVYRIIQELVNNSIRHSGGTHLHVLLKYRKPFLAIHVRDNGKGFCMEEVMQRGAGTGLHNIISRAELLHATIDIDASCTTGTHICMLVPVEIK